MHWGSQLVDRREVKDSGVTRDRRKDLEVSVIRHLPPHELASC